MINSAAQTIVSLALDVYIRTQLENHCDSYTYIPVHKICVQNKVL